MTETLAVLFVLFLSPLFVMIGGDNVTLSSSSLAPSSSLHSALSSSSSSSSAALAASSLRQSSSASPLALALATVAEPALLAHVHENTVVNFRHRHHPNHPWGPHFEENVVNITVREFQNIHLDCRVGLIEDKLVSWVVKRKSELTLLTLGHKNHSSDPRFISDFKYPNNWRLGIRNVSRNDSGMYLCQISTHPPKVLEVQLTVEAPEVFVISSRGERVQDVYYKEGSTLQLICEVNNVKSRLVNWYHNADLLNHDITRGGVSIKTEITGDHAKSILNLARITRKDIGTYRCTSPPQNATVTVHILNGENPAELYHNEGGRLLGLSHHFACFHNHHYHHQLVLAAFSSLLTSFFTSFSVSPSSAFAIIRTCSSILLMAIMSFGRTLFTFLIILFFLQSILLQTWWVNGKVSRAWVSRVIELLSSSTSNLIPSSETEMSSQL